MKRGLYWVTLIVMVVLLAILGIQIWEAGASRSGAPYVREVDDARVV